MRLRRLRDVFRGQDIYIVGSGPTATLFPMESLRDKICMGLNDAFKIHPAISPTTFMHHVNYAHAGKNISAPYHENFLDIKYPIVKGTGWDRSQEIEWDHPHYYFFDWSHDLQNIWRMTKQTDVLYYAPEGASVHAAMQLCWIMGVRNIYLIGCDSRTFGGKHYANYDKDGFRTDEVLKRGQERNYAAYIYGALIVREFLRKKGINVYSLSPFLGYTIMDYQYDFLHGDLSLEQLYRDAGVESPVSADQPDLETPKEKGG